MAMSSLSVVSNSSRLRGFTSKLVQSAAVAGSAAEPKVEVGADDRAMQEHASTGQGDDMSEKTAAIDPVCGMTVDSATAEYRSFHNGKAFYFCSAGCKGTFDKNPAKFAGASVKGGHEGH
jgi:Cu+-exporting ATPase